MGRKSDTPPVIVIPDCRAGHEWATREVYGIADGIVCGDFIEDRWVVVNLDSDGGRPITMPACRERDRFGDRSHNWCYRCPAGYIAVRLDKHDSARERDAVSA